ncbi:hypothetical protein M413DRAFT_443658 [Hebeloma cylindrosporum]|uniref:RING-type domain-containing protein n=1 Tax=Hebeloma cylindrosporum TaxID=76867 RepID=A0A0C3CJ55_HEBCY|nr:hypothetical protein M413DRAFT_443658 [Hebeloma cylindrosporum h7]
MLVLHPSSRCDVCLSEYSWDNSSARPHAIHCGHIFCRDCLYTTSPPLCPLCRKPYQPNKMKRLHVDRPDNIDDHKEIDLLQRLAISWETTPEQLEVVVTEVDLWLSSRSDDACIALRKARAALDNHLQLKDGEAEFEDTVQSLEGEIERLTYNVVNGENKLKITSKAYQQTIDELQSYVVNLNVELDRFRSQPYRYTRSHNPLPAPPEPISTDYIPSFQQAVLSSGAGSTRYTDLPTSPLSSPPQFEVERRSRKGKTRLSDRQYISDPRNPTPGPSSSHVQSHHSPHPPMYDPSSSYTTRMPGLQYDLDNTTQPLDAFSLTHAYLKEYSVGYVNGQAFANGRRATELSDNRRTPYPHANSSRHPPQTAGVYEPSSNSREPPLHTYHNQPYSAPVAGDRPSHRRYDTVTSLNSSRHEEGSSSRSRSRSRQRGSPSGSQGRQHGNAALASTLSSPPPRPPSRRQSVGRATPPVPSSRSVSFQQPIVIPEPEEETMLPSNALVPTLRRGSPVSQSRVTTSTWGTPAPSNMTRGSTSMSMSLLNFRTPRSEGGESSFHPFGSEGSNRRLSIIDPSVEAVPSQASPARPVQSMVGVLPGDAEVISASPRSNGNPYRSPTSLDIRSSHSSSWEATSSSRSRASVSTHGSGYQADNDRPQNQRDSQAPSSNHGWGHQNYTRDDRANTYRSPTSLGPRTQEIRSESHSYFYEEYRTQSYDESRPHHYQSQDDTSSYQSDRRSHSRHSHPGRAPRASLRELPSGSPFPITVDYNEDRRSLDHGSPGAGPSSSMPSIGNALGLDMSTGPTPISAPTPVVSNTAFLRTFSRDHYES